MRTGRLDIIEGWGWAWGWWEEKAERKGEDWGVERVREGGSVVRCCLSGCVGPESEKNRKEKKERRKRKGFDEVFCALEGGGCRHGPSRVYGG